MKPYPHLNLKQLTYEQNLTEEYFPGIFGLLFKKFINTYKAFTKP